MEFMLLFMDRKDSPLPRGDEPAHLAAMAEMGRFAGDLARQGKLRRGAPLAGEEEAVRIRVRDGRPLVSDGPFAETKEVLGGFWVIDVADREEAVDIARRCPHASQGNVEVHRLRFRDSVADPGGGVPFLLAFRMEPGLVDPDGSKLQRMIDHGNSLKRIGKFIETAPLEQEPPAVRLEPRRGRPVVVDGPFAEAKEAVGGYTLARVGDRAEAIEMATAYPHATWGPVEVREILFFDPT